MYFESKINIQYCFSKLEGLQLIIRTVVEFHLSYLGSARFFCRSYPDAHIKLSELLWLFTVIIILTLDCNLTMQIHLVSLAWQQSLFGGLFSFEGPDLLDPLLRGWKCCHRDRPRYGTKIWYFTFLKKIKKLVFSLVSEI